MSIHDQEPQPTTGEPKVEKNSKEQADDAFEACKLLLERGEMTEFFDHLDRAMQRLGDPDAVIWQQLMVDVYAKGINTVGRQEMDRLWDARFQDPEMREWMFGHL